MRKVFVTLCPQDNPAFLPCGISTEIYYAPIYEHAFKKVENAVRALGLNYEVVRASGCNIPGTISEITADLEDIVIFASPFVFLAKNADVEGAINYITKTDLGYSTVGSQRSLYMTVGISKMISKSSVGTPTEFINAITIGGARCPHADFADSEVAIPKSKLDFHQKAEAYRLEYLDYLIRFGVDIEATDSIVISPTVTIDEGVKINTGCHIYGSSHIARGAKISAGAVIKSSTIGECCVIGASKIEDCNIEKNVTVEDYCVLKERCHFISGVKIGNYCEIVNTTLLNDTTVASHCHIWDSEVGSRVTIGSGVITINYEINRKQSKCRIGDDAVIGCSSNLVLPVEIGAMSFVAAGSTVTDDVPTGALAIARQYQTNRNGWAAKRKNNGKHI
ncbi:MAG: hypothetical protein J6B45_04790 [Clostridia bacterium]|nr:hypothetical protein [Clostridia bacterium]